MTLRTPRIPEEPTRQAGSRRFVFEAIDDTTECVVSDVTFDVDDVQELYRIVGTNAAEIDSGAEYELEPQQVNQLKARYNIAFEPATGTVLIRNWHALDDLPYKIHTGRELALMLEGKKPLAYFSGQYPPNPEVEEIPERLFDPHVEDGRFVKREYVMFADNCGPSLRSNGLCMRIVMYALPEQEWRIDAMLLVLETAAKCGWSEGFERMQGSLLGYENWQNDIYIERIFRSTSVKDES